VDKYGAEDVGQWYWEVWNEPDYHSIPTHALKSTHSDDGPTTDPAPPSDALAREVRYLTKSLSGALPALSVCATRFAICVAPASLKCVPSVGVANTEDRFGTVL
jgi:hypothetical protein